MRASDEDDGSKIGVIGRREKESAARTAQRPYLLLVAVKEVLQGDDGLALVLLDMRRALAVPAGQAEGAQIEQRLQARRVVVDEGEVLVLHRTAHLRTRSGSRFNHSRSSFFSQPRGLLFQWLHLTSKTILSLLF